MKALKPKYIVDEDGKKTSVILSMEAFQSLLEKIDALEDIKLYDAAKNYAEPTIAMEEAFKMIEGKQK